MSLSKRFVPALVSAVILGSVLTACGEGLPSVPGLPDIGGSSGGSGKEESTSGSSDSEEEGSSSGISIPGIGEIPGIPEISEIGDLPFLKDLPLVSALTGGKEPEAAEETSAEETTEGSEAEQEVISWDGFSFTVPRGWSVLEGGREEGRWILSDEDSSDSLFITREEGYTFVTQTLNAYMTRYPEGMEYRQVGGADAIILFSREAPEVPERAEIFLENNLVIIINDSKEKVSAFQELLDSVRIEEDSLPRYVISTRPDVLEKNKLEAEPFVYHGIAVNLPEGSTVREDGENVSVLSPGGGLLIMFQTGSKALRKPFSKEEAEYSLKNSGSVEGFTGVDRFGDVCINGVLLAWNLSYGQEFSGSPAKLSIHGITPPQGDPYFTMTFVLMDESEKRLWEAVDDTIRPDFPWMQTGAASGEEGTEGRKESGSGSAGSRSGGETGTSGSGVEVVHRFHEMYVTIPEGYEMNSRDEVAELFANSDDTEGLALEFHAPEEYDKDYFVKTYPEAYKAAAEKIFLEKDGFTLNDFTLSEYSKIGSIDAYDLTYSVSASGKTVYFR